MSMIVVLIESSTWRQSAAGFVLRESPVFAPIATEIHVSWHVGNQDKSGLVVLNVSFVARDP